MSLAVVQGASGSIGSALAREILSRTSLQVVATSRDPSSARRAILDGGGLDQSRLTVLEVDLLEEGTIERAAKEVEQRWGKASVRLLMNVSGILHPDKSITQVKADELLHHYQINTFGHLLTYKHFMPLLPKNADLRKSRERGDVDLANGLVKEGLGVFASLTARVGSIGDNRVGGWVGYRSSKAATNQVIATLQRELSVRATPAIAIALHPGTVPGTNLSAAFTKKGDAGKKPGVMTAEDSANSLLDVISKLGEKDGGKFLDWAGKEIPW